MAGIEQVVTVRYVRELVEEQEKTHREVSDILRQKHPGVQGLSERSVRRYCAPVRAHFGQSNFSFFQQKRKKDILLILIIFAYFKVQKKREKKKMVSKIDHFFIFLILKLNSKIRKILLTAKSDIFLFLFS